MKMNLNFPSEPYWHLPVESLYQLVGSSRDGLSHVEASLRLKKQRQIPKAIGPVRRGVLLLWQQLKNPLLLLLIFTCAVSLTVGDFVEAIIMASIIIGSIILSSVQEYRAAIANEHLQQHLALFTTVLRSGITLRIPSTDVVSGDVVVLSAGNLIPADGVLIASKDLFVNEAVLTGESLPAEKHVGTCDISASIVNRRSCIYMGTSVRSGSATMLAIRTGSLTEFGIIAANLESPIETTKFELGLRDFGLLLSRVMLVFLSLTLLANVLMHRHFLETMLFALAIAVGISPQLLPAILSTTLSRGLLAMAKEGVLVKRLNAIENLGLMDVLCTDKTGTLTTGNMTVNDVVDVSGNSSSSLALYVYLNASMQSGVGNPLDEAIQEYGKNKSFDDSKFKKVDELPFDFFRKRLTIIVHEHNASIDLMICKGAVENVLEICDRIVEGGQTVLFSPELKENIHRSSSQWANNGIRAIGIALREEPHRDYYNLSDEHSFVFYGFLLTSDELRPETIETIKELGDLGVSLRMITGDSRFVAKAVAKQLGLQTHTCLTGEEIHKMSDEAFWHAVDSVQVFAEVDPQQKARIVIALKQMSHVVGFLGDGINDAVALKIADVGISVQTAVDVARESADLVLVKSGLAVLKRGIIMGRTIFANTRKYILITSSANFGNLVSMAFASLFLNFLPLLPVQVLLNNFLTDFPALLIGTDRVDADQLQTSQKWDFGVIKKYMFFFGGLSSLIDGMTFLILFLVFKASQQEFRSSWFVVCVLTELATIFIIRTTRPFYASRPSLALIISSVFVSGLTLLLIYTRLGAYFGFVPLALQELLSLLAITILFFVAGELCKYAFFRPVPHS